MKILIKLALSAIAILIIARFLEQGVQVDSFTTSLIVAIVLGLLNTFVKPIIKLLTLPITLMTMGLSLLIINAVMVMVADHFIAGFQVNGILWAFAFSFLLSVVTYILEFLFNVD